MWTTAPRVRVNMGAFVLINSTDTLANASQDTMVIIVVVSIHIRVYFASVDENGPMKMSKYCKVQHWSW